MKRWIIVAVFALWPACGCTTAVSPHERAKKDEVCYDGKPASWWVKAMKDRSASYRLKAIEALAEIGADGDGVVDALIAAAAKDRNAPVRSKAAQALGGVGGAKVEPALVAVLADKDDAVRDSAALALGRMALGPDLAAELADALITDYRPGGKPWIKATVGRPDRQLIQYGDIDWVKKIPNLREVELIVCSNREEGKLFRCLREIASLRKLTLRDSQIDAKSLANLKDIPGLEEMDLNCCGAAMLQAPGLKRLTLTHDAGSLADLEKLKGLEELTLTDREFSPLELEFSFSTRNGGLKAGDVAHLKDLKNLRKLKLAAAGIDAAALIHLRGLTNLAELDLTNTSVTVAGIEELRTVLTKTTIRTGAKKQP